MSLDVLLRRCPPGVLLTPVRSAAHYASQWREMDEGPWAHLQPSAPDGSELTALRELVSRYRVARNLPLRYDRDVGMPRLQPLLRAVEEVRAQSPAHVDAVAVVQDLTDRIAASYGGARVVSLASKVSWFMFRSPVVIYDSLARDALGVRVSDYEMFYNRWREVYEGCQEVITAASSSYSQEEWFRERVFDILLWQVGNARRQAGRDNAPATVYGRTRRRLLPSSRLTKRCS